MPTARRREPPYKLDRGDVKWQWSKGRWYAYFRTGTYKPGPGKREIMIPLPRPDDPGFFASLASCKAGRTRRHNVAELLTVAALIEKREQSPEYRRLAAATRDQYEIYHAYLARELRGKTGSAPVHLVERKDIMTLRDELSVQSIDEKGRVRGGPGAANAMVKAARALWSWGVDRELVTTNPCHSVELFAATDHAPWPETLLQAALTCKDGGIRLPVALLYFTAQRIGDVCAMRWGDLRDGMICLTQQKTGKDMEIRLHSALGEELARVPKRSLTILSDDQGRPLRPETLRHRLQRFAADRGFKVVPHGLRKNAVNALLEVGCSVAETAAVTGQSLAMVEKYAKKRNGKKLASAAILKLEGRGQ